MGDRSGSSVQRISFIFSLLQSDKIAVVAVTHDALYFHLGDRVLSIDEGHMVGSQGLEKDVKGNTLITKKNRAWGLPWK